MPAKKTPAKKTPAKKKPTVHVYGPGHTREYRVDGYAAGTFEAQYRGTGAADWAVFATFATRKEAEEACDADAATLPPKGHP